MQGMQTYKRKWIYEIHCPHSQGEEPFQSMRELLGIDAVLDAIRHHNLQPDIHNLQPVVMRSLLTRTLHPKPVCRPSFHQIHKVNTGSSMATLDTYLSRVHDNDESNVQ